jgi:uncharacterized protein (DUF1501 family)
MTKKTTHFNRRKFLKQSSALSLAGGISMLGLDGFPFIQGVNAATCPTTSSPRSLVCIFLQGGADSFNMFVPRGDRYSEYAATRGNLAIPLSNLTTVEDPQNGTFGFNSLLQGMHDLYRNGDLAVISNVGPLITPLTKEDYLTAVANNDTSTIPQSLFAHDAQQKLWQTGAGKVSGTDSFGWGGSIAAQLAQCNANPAIPSAFSIAGTNTWSSNQNILYGRLNPNTNLQRMFGYEASQATWIPAFSRISREDKLNAILSSSKSAASPLEQSVAHAISQAVDTTAALEQAVTQHPVSEMTYDRNNVLASQLHMVARLIEAREQLGMERQVFFVRMGGWDTHGNQSERLPVLLTELNEALTSFQRAITGMQLADSVTSFTASDFGRTLTNNGDGTDHGWGSHQFVFGGAVQGGQIYGQVPSYLPGGIDDTGIPNDNPAGRIIPTTSVIQYGTTLAKWMGITDENNLASIFPNLSNFSTWDLGFIRS